MLAPGAPSPRSGCEGLIVDMARAEAKNCVVLGDGLQRSYVGENQSFRYGHMTILEKDDGVAEIVFR